MGKNVRQVSVDALEQVASIDECIIREMRRLNDNSWTVRQAAVQMLAMLAQKGDECVISAVAVCLEDAGAKVRQAAVEALAEVAERGDECVVGMVKACLADRHKDVR